MKNKKAITFLNGLVSSGKIDTGSWSFSSADGNKLLGAEKDDWATYGKCHLEIDPEADPDTKGAYGYPVAKYYGDEIKISRRGVIAAKGAAAGSRGAVKDPELEAVADALLRSINIKLELDEDCMEEEYDLCTKKKKKMDGDDFVEDGDNDSAKVKAAKNAVVNSLKSGKIKKPDKCQKCGATGDLEAHHHKGYDKEHQLDVQWLCIPCHKAADVKIRASKKKDGLGEENSFRYDRIEAPPWMTRKFELTPEGYLSGRAVVTNVGVFMYKNQDGSTRRELRLPSEVFHPDSIASLKMKPITNGHPTEPVTAENVAKYGKGMTGNNPSYPTSWADDMWPKNPEYVRGEGKEIGDGYHLAVDMTITDPDTILEIRSGKEELSCGYSVQMDETPGVWMGIPYDVIQRKIRYNHIAVVDQARAGEAARIRLDSTDAFCVGEVSNINDMEDDMKSIRLDGVEYQAEAKVIETLVKTQNDLQTKTDELTQVKTDTGKKISELEAERDAYKGKLDKAEADLKAAQEATNDPKRRDQEVKARMELLSIAGKAKVEVKDGDDDLAIKKAVISKVFPKLSLDGKDVNYIAASFDIAKEDLIKTDAASGENINVVLKGDKPDDTGMNADEAHKKYVESLSNGWKGGQA